MIDRAEIKDKARELEVNPINVQRDYVFGWLLFAIYTGTELRDVLILKGGNGLRKAYFEHTRFSGDLDFSTQTKVDPEFLKEQLGRACRLAQAASGVAFEPDKTRVEDGWSASREQHVYKARLYFHDFFGNREELLISVKLDVTELDRIYLPIQTRNLIHAYSDQKECQTAFPCLSLEETLAAKLKCLIQRRHVADLYDLAYAVFVDRTLDVNRSQVAQVFFKKTIFEPSPRAAMGILAGLPLERLEDAWRRFVVCPKQSVLDFGKALSDFRSLVAEMFGAMPNRMSELAFFPSELRNPIMEAGSSLTLLKVTYEGIPRMVEPYSLVFKRRKDGVAREYLYVYDRTGGRSGSVGIKSFVADGFGAIENTDERFEPREEVVIAKAGEPGDALYFGNQSPFYKRPVRKAARSLARAHQLAIKVQCPYCQRQFARKTRTLALRPHKDRFGNRCYGRRGFLVS